MRKTTCVLLFILYFVFIGVVASGGAQTRPVEGLRHNPPAVHALIHARVVQASGTLEDATVIIRGERIAGVGANMSVPADARIWDYSGLTVYPGFIDLYAHIGVKAKKKNGAEKKKPGSKSGPPTYWNALVTPEKNVVEAFAPSAEDIRAYLQMGFTAALVVPEKGVFKGHGAVISLKDSPNNERVLKENAVQAVAFERQQGRRAGYPTSLMGAVALIRQALLDADWYAKAQVAYRANPEQSRPEVNEALDILSKDRKTTPFVFETQSDQDVRLALNIAREFGLTLWLRGSGYEYRILPELKKAGVPLILPVNFPKAPDVDTPEDALDVSVEALSHWEAAPSNPRFLSEKNIPFVLTTDLLKNPAEFRKQIGKALAAGVSEAAVLRALTEMPAAMLGLQQQLGSLAKGKLAHLFVTRGSWFDEGSKVIDVWVDGQRKAINPQNESKAAGTWQMTLNIPESQGKTWVLELSGSDAKLTGRVKQDSVEEKLKKVSLVGERIQLLFKGEPFGVAGVLTLSGRLAENSLSGHGMAGKEENWFGWRATREKRPQEKSKQTSETGEKKLVQVPAGSPPGAFATLSPPGQPAAVLVKNATIWTCGPQGKLENAMLLVRKGKIQAAGSDLRAPAGALVIDARGKHVTPGLIDAHSHTGIRQGVNEVGQAVTAEVRVADARDSHDIAFYRELAGGLTIANSLHGSANPIGGQNQVVKLRWGESAGALVVKDAIPGIKFALGENVKQSNWGDQFTKRYPQTRMGVEQIIRDRFEAAQEYEKKWQAYRALKKKDGIIPPRKDLELDALIEILHGKRLVHSHSYRQDEILMLMRVAEDFGFQIGTFQHVLEGYKVAEVLAKHGAGASTFSDWWAYKFEVYDAIPYNGALMHDAGVVVSFNSDSNELARRMNLEAAKAVKYGGVSEEEALKFVTLNPARQLRIDHRVGSLEAGKDADFVIWSGHPLSTYSVCEQTWIDGRKYFDIQKDREMRLIVSRERNRLIQKILTQSSSGKVTAKANGKH